MLLSASTFDPKENDLAIPGIAMTKAKTEIQAFLDQRKTKSMNINIL